ncbi:uncharacterized protein F5891DRAFT_1188026 [Suillus fuscotomentosus]|uniref:Uncharacterized protein n=1 Tax=Suillus fuscotomentosus TaxID=1912939 RepID=A0AAD4HLU6_9AGAM|nr:uncharacterized protein F5891DRAFT_1188026 [Suillus fuscotomentosus]KAG1900926.1 hypothetical protein F5891DRAFT_1188026 [Suillus fuscotomentosus]
MHSLNPSTLLALRSFRTMLSPAHPTSSSSFDELAEIVREYEANEKVMAKAVVHVIIQPILLHWPNVMSLVHILCSDPGIILEQESQGNVSVPSSQCTGIEVSSWDEPAAPFKDMDVYLNYFDEDGEDITQPNSPIQWNASLMLGWYLPVVAKTSRVPNSTLHHIPRASDEPEQSEDPRRLDHSLSYTVPVHTLQSVVGMQDKQLLFVAQQPEHKLKYQQKRPIHSQCQTSPSQMQPHAITSTSATPPAPVTNTSTSCAQPPDKQSKSIPLWVHLFNSSLYIYLSSLVYYYCLCSFDITSNIKHFETPEHFRLVIGTQRPHNLACPPNFLVVDLLQLFGNVEQPLNLRALWVFTMIVLRLMASSMGKSVSPGI